MRPGRVRAGEWLAGLAGILLLVALLLPWYEASIPLPAGTTAYAPGPAPSLTAWQAFAVTDVLLALLALSGPALLLVQATRRSPALPAALSVVAVSCGLAATVLVLARIVLQPGDDAAVDLRVGAWLGLLGAVGLLGAGWRSMGTERSPGAPAPRVEVRAAPPAAG
jgi:hypothetical protein